MSGYGTGSDELRAIEVRQTPTKQQDRNGNKDGLVARRTSTYFRRRHGRGFSLAVVLAPTSYGGQQPNSKTAMSKKDGLVVARRTSTYLYFRRHHGGGFSLAMVLAPTSRRQMYGGHQDSETAMTNKDSSVVARRTYSRRRHGRGFSLAMVLADELRLTKVRQKPRQPDANGK